jgi:hypothetical protein
MVADSQMTAMRQALDGIAPRDEIEGTLVVQMIGAHNAVMECYRRAATTNSEAGRNESLSQANRLARTLTMLVEALDRYRGKARQTMTVEHVHIHPGGQAVVGMVKTPGGPAG